MTKVFISYSWEDDEHKNWVRSLTDKLLENGIDATLDQYDLSLGDRLPQFMEQSVTNADYVLIICTPTYKKRQMLAKVESVMKDISLPESCLIREMSVNLFL